MFESDDFKKASISMFLRQATFGLADSDGGRISGQLIAAQTNRENLFNVRVCVDYDWDLGSVFMEVQLLHFT